MLSNRLLSIICMTAGVLILATLVVFLRVMDLKKNRHAMHSLRQLTIWNLIINAMFLMCIMVLPPKLAFVLGLTVATMNLFVLLARSAMLPFKNWGPTIVFLDAVTHYVIPVIAVALVMLKTHASESHLGRSPLRHSWKSLLVFLGILVFWLLVNLWLYHKTGTWAYNGKVGHVKHMTPKQAGWLVAAIAASFGVAVGLTAVTLKNKRPTSLEGSSRSRHSGHSRHLDHSPKHNSKK